MLQKKKKAIIDVLKEALQQETEAFNYYYKVSKKALYPETKSLLIQLAEEERKHRLFIIKEIQRIEKIMAKDTIKDIDLDYEVQYSLPVDIVLKRLESSPGVDFGAISLPGEFLGGDYIDAITLNRKGVIPALGILLYDVMGHGLEATHLKAYGKKIYGHLLEAWVRGQKMVNLNQPQQMMKYFNRKLINKCQAAYSFISAFYGVVDSEGKIFNYTSAGHEPPILVKQGGEYIHLSKTDLIIGVDKDLAYSKVSVPIDAGDVIVLFSDGITEAGIPGEYMFGRERLQQVIQKAREASASEIIRQIVKDLEEFLDGEPMTDEFTLAVMKVNAI